MTFRTRALAAALLLTAAPLLAACGGSSDAGAPLDEQVTTQAPVPVQAVDPAHDACMGEAATQAATIEGVDPSTLEGDYELMGLCDELVWAYPDDEGRVVHAVGCVAEYVEGHIKDGVFEAAYADGTQVPELMNDPFSIGVCV